MLPQSPGRDSPALCAFIGNHLALTQEELSEPGRGQDMGWEFSGVSHSPCPAAPRPAPGWDTPGQQVLTFRHQDLKGRSPGMEKCWCRNSGVWGAGFGAHPPEQHALERQPHTLRVLQEPPAEGRSSCLHWGGKAGQTEQC